jgi:hypothetical protein
MADRVTLTQPVYMPLAGQWCVVLGGSTIDVASSSAFAPGHITNVTPGGGTLLNGVHNNPVSNVRIR